MLGLTITEKCKRVSVLKGGIEKDQKAAMPWADKSDKTPTVLPLQIRYHCTWLQRCRCWRRGWTSWYIPLRDVCQTTLMSWFTGRTRIHSTCHFIPISSKVPNAVDRSLWRVKGSFGVVQNPHALIRCSWWDHLLSFPNYIERSCQDMV